MTNYRFVKSQRDEQLLLQAKQAWRKRVPAITVESPELLQVLDTSVSLAQLAFSPRVQVLTIAVVGDANSIFIGLGCSS